LKSGKEVKVIEFDKSRIVAAKPIARSFPEIVFVVMIHIYHKRSKNFDKRPNLAKQ